ncbi:MAG TPA: hypothetical protein ENI52_04025 [Thermoplasmata archaeon]|nr:hypothetical protein [Thermoplasmata archaeon]
MILKKWLWWLLPLCILMSIPLILFILMQVHPNSNISSNNISSQTVPSSLSIPVIEIIDWTNRLSSSGNFYYIEGVVKNTGNAVADFVEITVKALDKNNKLVALEQSYTNPLKLQPNEEATFKIMIDNIPRIKNFSIKATWQ